MQKIVNKEIETIVKEDKSEIMPIDLDEEMNETLKELVFMKLKNIVNKESLALFARGIKESPDNYVKLAGESLVNHIITEVITEKLNQEKDSE
jgi:hypothetical protein